MFNQFVSKIVTITRNDEAANMAEYALIGALVAVVAIGAFTALGGSITGVISSIAGAI